ncbi:putative RNA methyltransferase [Aurantivibrio infirmus]
MSIWICPVCAAPLIQEKSAWLCSNKHSFDQAKEGYVNLLLANQKGSKLPGDSPEMLKARREFLSGGYYENVAKKLAEIIEQLKLNRTDSEPCQLVDSGCGEGYYLDFLQKNLSRPIEFSGLDIAKDGVRLAAKNFPAATWVCGSAARLPIASASLDYLLRIFAPGDDAEVQRCLKDDGKLIVLSPAGNHLREIKQFLYDEVRLHSKPKNIPGFSLCSQDQVEYVLNLQGSSVIKNLLAMTPFFWQSSYSARSELLKLNELAVTVHVFISQYEKV